MLTIPGEVLIGGKPYEVTRIGDNAFNSYPNKSIDVRQLKVSENITDIGTNAFQGCGNLQNVWLPSTLTSMGANVFAGSKLARVCTESIFDINEDVFPSYSAFLFVPVGTAVKGLPGWGRFARVYEGYYVGDTTPNDDKTYVCLKQKNDDGTAILIDSKSNEPIPNYVTFDKTQYKVTIIGEAAFSGKGLNLEDWSELPESIVKIEKNAFKNCGLKEFKLPSKLTTIGDDAFNGCSALKQITLPQTLSSIGARAFSGNACLEELVLPGGIEEIKEKAFQNCKALKQIELPASLKSIGDNIFDGCNNLTDVISKVKGDGVDSKSEQSVPHAILYVPDGCVESYYEKWTFLHTVKGDRELGNYNGLYYAYSTVDKQAIVIGVDPEHTDIVVPGTVILDKKECKVFAIERDVFRNKTAVKTVTIGENIETIGTNAFRDCSNLRKIVLPSTLKSIGENSFMGCNNLAEVVCNSIDNKFITENILSMPNATLYVPERSRYEGKWEFAHIYEGEIVEKDWNGIRFACLKGAVNEAVLVDATDATKTSEAWPNGEIEIPTKVAIGVGESAGDYEVIALASKAFCGNTAVKLVKLPSTLTSIDATAFEGCTNLTEVVSKIENQNVIDSIALSLPDAILYVPDRAKYEGANWNFAQILVGDRVKEEQNGLSYICATGDKTAVLVKGSADQLGNSVSIPETITIKIGEGANVKDLECKVIAIAANAFHGCTSLNQIWLPSTIESIGEKAFDGCNDIAYICTTGNTPLSINKNVFSTYKATLYVPNGTTGSYSENETWKTFPIIREGYFEGVTTQNNLTFECLLSGEDNVATLKKSEVSETIVDIPASVTLDNTDYSVTTIYKEAFRGNNSKKLEKIILPETLKTIEDNAFDQCSKLTIITNKSKTPAVLGKDVFVQSIYSSATVYVPNDAEIEAKYKDAEGWKNFTNWAHGEKKAGTVGSMTYDYLVGVGTATLTGSTVDKEEVTIDGTVEIDGVTYTVTAIAESAFKNNPNRGKMTKLRIAKNITTIGAYAFQSCSNLKMVWLPTSITSIGEKAFDGCNGITHVSSSIESPAENEANYFPNNATLYVPKGGKDKYNVSGWNNVSYVAEGEFVDVCTEENITYDCLTIDDIKRAILRKYAASSNDVVIPDSVKLGEDYYKVAIIGKSAFANKTSITSLIIPSGVEGIDADVFSGCSKLTWIESKIESPIDISGKNVFANNTATLFIPKDKVTEYRAKGWDFLNIYIGDRKETTIEGWTYVYSTGDKKAILTKVNSVGKDVTIDGLFKIGKDDYAVTAIAEAVFKGKTNIEGMTISENIENIGANAFQGCEKIEKVELPSTLKTIGDKAFDGCSHLVSITCNGATPATVGADAFPSYNLTLNVPSDAVETYKKDASWGQFTTILGVVTTISDEDADDNTADYVDTTPSEDGANPTVTLVDGSDVHDAFAIPETVLINNISHAVTAIGANAFKNNTNLKEVTISSNITSIGESAFEGCKNLASITVDIVVPLDLSAPATTRGKITRSGGSSIFEGVDKKTCILYVPSGSVDAYKAAPVWGDFENILPIGTTAINGVIVSDNDKPFDVYNMQGRKVKENTTTLKGLPSGIYIVNGKKLMVK